MRLQTNRPAEWRRKKAFFSCLWLQDDTLPGGPREVQRHYTAPFARASREDDYRVAWAFFESYQN